MNPDLQKAELDATEHHDGWMCFPCVISRVDVSMFHMLRPSLSLDTSKKRQSCTIVNNS